MQNIVTILISATLIGVALTREEALIRGRSLFQCGYPKVWRLQNYKVKIPSSKF